MNFNLSEHGLDGALGNPGGGKSTQIICTSGKTFARYDSPITIARQHPWSCNLPCSFQSSSETELRIPPPLCPIFPQ